MLWQHDGAAMLEMVDSEPVPVPKTHFGYTDGITATPPILGGPEPVAPDHQEACDRGSWSSPRTPTATSSRARRSSGATGASVGSR